MSKTIIDKTYTWLLKNNTTTIQEITEAGLNKNQNNKYVYDKIITPLLKEKKVDRVRRGLYTAIDPVTDRPVADPIIVASKICTPYYLGYYTALTLYGSAYSTRTEAHICVPPGKMFREFTYNGTTYTPVYTKDTTKNIKTMTHRGQKVQVCGKERLIVELIEKPELIGGWEQALKSLESLGGIEYEKIPEILRTKDIQILTRRTGYILELLREHSIFHQHLPDQVISQLLEMVQGQPEYMEKKKTGPLEKRWMLYISPGFNEYIRGI